MERLVFVRVLKARQNDADVPNGVGGIGLGDAQGQEVQVVVDLDANPAGGFLDDLRAIGELDLAFALIQTGIHPGGVAELAAGSG